MPPDSLDIAEWDDGAWCYWEDIQGFGAQRAPDYLIIRCGSPEWQRLVAAGAFRPTPAAALILAPGAS